MRVFFKEQALDKPLVENELLDSSIWLMLMIHSFI